MAFYASRRVDCSSPRKKCVEQNLKDEAGNPFSLQMYECGEFSCEINQKRQHGEKELRRFMAQEDGAMQNEESNYSRTRTGKRRTHHIKLLLTMLIRPNIAKNH